MEVLFILAVCLMPNIFKAVQIPSQINISHPEGQISLSALDCKAATDITSVRLDNACRLKSTTSNIKNVSAAILQKVETHIVSGYRCTKVETKLQSICGLFGHFKLYAPPQVIEPVVTTIQDCEDAMRYGSLTLPDGSTKPVQLNRRSFYKLVSIGDIWQSADNVKCKGGTETIDNKTVNDVIEFVSGQFIIEEINFEVSSNSIVDMEANVKLPELCSNRQKNLACQTAVATYLIKDLGDSCNLQQIRKLMFSQTEIVTAKGKQVVLINKEHKIILNLKGESQLEGCQNMKIYDTNYAHLKLYLLETSEEADILAKRRSVNPNNVQLETEIRVAADYDLYIRELQLYEYSRSLGINLCSMTTSLMDKMIRSPFHSDRLLVTRGDVLQEIHCQNVTVVARIGENRLNKCLLNWLPVWQGSTPVFLHAGTHIITPTISQLDQVECSAKFTAIFAAIDGSLIVADPDVQVLSLPLQYETLQHEMMHISDYQLPIHDDTSADLLYTDREVAAFNDLLHYKHAQERVLTHLVGKYCHQSDDCGSYQPATSTNFDLQQLKDQLSPWNWISRVLDRIQYFGSVCSIIIALYFMGNFLYKVFSCASLVSRDRIQASKALKLSFFTEQVFLRSLIPDREKESKTPENKDAVPTIALEEQKLLSSTLK